MASKKKLPKLPIPDHIARRNNDYVSYTVKGKDGKKKAVDYICYANHMSVLSDNEFLLEPRRDRQDWKKFAIDNPTYIRVVELFKQHGVIPETVKAWIDSKSRPMMRVPKGCSRHRAYASMCVYRFCESYAPLPWVILKISDDMPKVSFAQAVHYGMSLYVGSTGHNFCNIAVTSNVYMNTGQAYNLALSLAFPLFWSKSEKQLSAIGGQTCSAMQNLSNSIGPTKASGKGKMALPTLLIDGSDKGGEILNEKWTPLYRYVEEMATKKWTEEKVRDGLKERYDEICKASPEIVKLRDKLDNPRAGSY